MLLFPQKYVSELTEFKHSVPRNQVPESFFPPSNMAATSFVDPPTAALGGLGLGVPCCCI